MKTYIKLTKVIGNRKFLIRTRDIITATEVEKGTDVRFGKIVVSVKESVDEIYGLMGV